MMAEVGVNLFWDLAVAAQAGLNPRRLTIFPGPHSITDAIRGIVPLEWSLALRNCSLPLAKARSVASKVGAYLVTAAHAALMQPRCDAQIAHEHTLMITQQAKMLGKVCAIRIPCRALLRPCLTHVSHSLAGFCPQCKLSFVDHHG